MSYEPLSAKKETELMPYASSTAAVIRSPFGTFVISMVRLGRPMAAFERMFVSFIWLTGEV